MKDLFLDANAHVAMSRKTLSYYTNFNTSKAAHGHPSSASLPGREAASAIEGARKKIASLLDADSPNQIFFTSSCTQACEWAVKIISKRLVTPQMSQMEHPAVTRAVNKYIPQHYLFGCFPSGVIDLSNFEAAAVPNPLVSAICIHVQNEIGTIQPIHKIKEKYPRSYIFSDMSQSLGKTPISLRETDVDIAVFGAHKFGGPSGVGFMYLKNTDHWREFGTGSRYFMDAPGTPNVSGIAATAVALQEALETLPERMSKMKSFQGALELGLKKLGFEIVGDEVERVANTTFAKVPATDNFLDAGLMLQMKLADQKIHIGLGSACGSMHTGGSPLMKALGRPSDGQEYIRISQWGEYDEKDADTVLKAIEGCL